MGPIDHARQQRARAALAGERDKLLKNGTERLNLNKNISRTTKDRSRAVLVALAMAVAGMLGYAVMIAEWFLAFHSSLAQTMVVLVVLLCVSAMLTVCSARRALGKDRPWLRYMGALLFVSTVTGTLCGFLLYYKYLVYYWHYSEMRTYTNVAAAQSNVAFQDGGMFLFTEDTKVDTSQSVGYQSRWDGNTYCVAPVIDSTMGGSDSIFYWAIGEGCCQARASFFCDDAMDQSVRSALVVLQPTDIVRSYMKWAVPSSDYTKYKEAVKLAEGNYYIKAAPEPEFLYWTKDPVSFKDSFYTAAKSVATNLGIAYFCVELVVCYLLAWSLNPTSKNPAVLRQNA
jgi:hypothetical protein